MNLNQSFPCDKVTSLSIHLSFAMLEIVSAAVQEIQMIISGDDKDVNDIRVLLQENGELSIDQPAYVLRKNLTSDKWMQVIIRVPAKWKGSVEAGTTTSNISLRGISGDSCSLDSSCGGITIKKAAFSSVNIQSVSSDIIITDAQCENALFKTVCGNITTSACSFHKIKMSSVSGVTTLDLTDEVSSVDCNTVSGKVMLFTPQTELCTVLRSMSGKIFVDGIDIVPHAGNVPIVNMTSVSGQLEMHCVNKE